MAESQEVEARNRKRVELLQEWRVELTDLPILRRLGRGLSGYFYETTSGGKKCVRKDFPLGSAERNSVFEREVKKVCKLDAHPNVVKCFGYTVGRNSCSLVQEYVADDLQNSVQRRIDQEVIRKRGTSTPGPSRVLNLDEIKHLLSSRGKEMEKGEMKVADAGVFEAVPEAADIISQIATGMRYLHENGVVHGDLKPRNVLVLNSDQSGGWKVKLADYGLTETKKRIRMVSERTRRAEILTWKAPECLGTKNLNHGSLDDDCLTDSDTDSDEETEVEFLKSKSAMADVYSFGLTCSYILVGKPMFSDMSLTQLRQRRMQGFRPKLPESASLEYLKGMIGACVEPDPMERPTFSMICNQITDQRLLQLKNAMEGYSGLDDYGSLKDGSFDSPEQINTMSTLSRAPGEIFPSSITSDFESCSIRKITNLDSDAVVAAKSTYAIKETRNRDVFSKADGDERSIHLARVPQNPNDRIEVKILLWRALSLQDMFNLTLNLQQDGMQVVSGQEKNKIFVSGIPPDHHYNAQSVLAKVISFDKGARIVF